MSLTTLVSTLGSRGGMNNSFGENTVVRWLRQDLYFGEFATNKLPVAAVMVHGNYISKKKESVWICQMFKFSRTVLVNLILS